MTSLAVSPLSLIFDKSPADLAFDKYQSIYAAVKILLEEDKKL